MLGVFHLVSAGELGTNRQPLQVRYQPLRLALQLLRLLFQLVDPSLQFLLHPLVLTRFRLLFLIRESARFRLDRKGVV